MFLFSDSPSEDLLTAFAKQSKKYKRQFHFVHSTITTGMGLKISEVAGISSKHENSILILKFENGKLKKFILRKIFDEPNFKDFVQSFEDKSLP